MAVPDLKDALDRLQEQDVDGAIESLKGKIDELPAHLTAHVLLARAYETKGQWDRALTCWENAHFLMPNSPVAREGKQRVLQRMDQGDNDASDDSPLQETDADPEEAPTPDGDPGERAGPEATEGGAHPTPKSPPSPDSAGPSNLDELRRQADEEARRRARDRGPGEEAPRGHDDTDRGEQIDDPLAEYEDEGDGDLDHLIQQLESARIEPDPNLDEVEPPDLSNDVDDLVSETLARIHEAQNQYRQAAQIYVKLASQEPEKARSYLERAAEMREKAEQNAEADD